MVDLFISKDEKMEALEKRMRVLERKLETSFEHIEKSFDMMKDVLVQIQNENVELKRDRDFLLGRYKEILKNVPTAGKIGSIAAPIKNEIMNSAVLIRDITREELLPEEKTSIDQLFEMVMNRKRVPAEKASRELGVDEKKIKYWALSLQRKGLIRMEEKLGKTLLVKNS